MKRILLAICMMAVSVVSSYGQSIRASFTFAWLSDVHLNSFTYAEDDLRQAIEDINANPAVDFTILSGDVTEFGDTKEFLLLQEILNDFRKPYLLLPGNHDVNWSENGSTMFNKIFKASHFCHDWQGVRFIGCGAGPSLRMGPPHIPREEILWLDSIVRTTPREQPVIFVNHFPLNQDLSNWYEVTDILKTRNVLVALAGHLHTNRSYDAEGIPAVIGRSSLRREAPIGGYNLVTINQDSITFRERIIKTETRPATDSERVYLGTWGAMFYAIDRKSGEKIWEFNTGRGRYFSPDGKTMYVKGIRNNITAADISKGSYIPLWNTQMPYENNFIPTRMETTEEYVFIPTEFGVVHAVRTDGSGIAWSHKVSHSAVTSLKNAGDRRLIVMTMDGTVTCLTYP